MIQGTVPTGGRKRDVWWVDPGIVRPIVPLRWLAPLVLAANVLARLPPSVLPEGSVWGRLETMALGVAFGALLVFLPGSSRDEARDALHGIGRALFLAAMAASIATAVVSARDLVQGFLAGWSGGGAPPARTWGEFATWAVGATVVALVLDRRDRQRVAAAHRERQLREARDAALRARLAPHFIFNALGTLQAQIEKDPAAASATTDALARLFRQALAAVGRPLVPLREELEFVEAYLGIERARLGDRLHVKVEISEELEEVQIPPLSLQVLVENAVRHGIAPREDGGEIRVCARRSGPGENPGIVLSVENPLAATPRPGTGNGLETLRGRLASPGDLTVSTANGVHRAEFWWSTA